MKIITLVWKLVKKKMWGHWWNCRKPGILQIDIIIFQYARSFNQKINIDGIIEVPSIKNKPVNIHEVFQGEEKALPWLFPKGQFGILHDSPSKL